MRSGDPGRDVTATRSEPPATLAVVAVRTTPAVADDDAAAVSDDGTLGAPADPDAGEGATPITVPSGPRNSTKSSDGTAARTRLRSTIVASEVVGIGPWSGGGPGPLLLAAAAAAVSAAVSCWSTWPTRKWSRAR